MLNLLVKYAFSLTYYLLFAVNAIDHGGILKSSGSAIYYKIHIIT